MLNRDPSKRPDPAARSGLARKQADLDLKIKYYEPSVLMVASASVATLKLKWELERNGCQVELLDPKLDNLAATSQKYFEAIILDVEKFSKTTFRAYRKLQATPDLTGLPLILLGVCDDPKPILNRLERGMIYYLAKEEALSVSLWQLIKQIHYLSRRYLPLSVI